MRFYLIVALFVVVVVCSVAAAMWCRRKLGSIVALVVGALLSAGAVYLFFLNKSDSVADTFVEKLADAAPPIVTGSAVIGWWVGFALVRVIWGPKR